MNFQDHGRTLPDNVVAFPGVRLARSQHRAPTRRRADAISGTELNARLMMLLGICVSGAALAVSAAHFLHG